MDTKQEIVQDKYIAEKQAAVILLVLAFVVFCVFGFISLAQDLATAPAWLVPVYVLYLIGQKQK